MMRPLPRHAARLALLAPLALAACGHERHTYRSFPHTPQNVTLVDTATGESLWTYEVPVGQELSVQFRRHPTLAEQENWDEMYWTVGRIGDRLEGKPNTMRVPPASRRRLDLSLRHAPEVTPVPPPATTPTTAAAATPAPASAPAAPANGAAAKKPAPPGLALPDPKQAAPK